MKPFFLGAILAVGVLLPFQLAWKMSFPAIFAHDFLTLAVIGFFGLLIYGFKK